MLISGTTELAAVQLVLKFLGGCWWELISCHSQRPVYSFDFCFTGMSNVNRGWNPASQKGAWGKLSERFPKTVVEKTPLAHLQIIVALFWKTYELLFCWDFSVVCLAIVVKLVETVFTTLPFWRLSPTWLNLFGLLKLNSVDDWKKPGIN